MNFRFQGADKRDQLRGENEKASQNMAASSNQKVHRDYEIAKLQARVKALEYENSMIVRMLQRVIVSNSQNASFQQQPSYSEMQSDPISSSQVTFDRNALKEINDASEFYDLDDDDDEEEDYEDEEADDEGHENFENYEDYEEEEEDHVHNEEEHNPAPVTTLEADVLIKAFEKAIQTSHCEQ
ncbi:putative uncharacterized protein DDB_G0272194 [Tigriopus californicus]|uniref:putative uncharacterized protein DDB_G0272194 n=1 Tax=Tigriopus californicus TaxID=6832 RepID=UPI0027DA4910|nr:putative uncharacterized protein DDB_G0272194 [Tigriopus californicus]